MASKSFDIEGGGAHVRVTLTENAGDIDVKVEVLDTNGYIADLRGLFFNLPDATAALGAVNLADGAGGDDVTLTAAQLTFEDGSTAPNPGGAAVQIDDGNVTNLGSGVNINGPVRAENGGGFDVGIEFGDAGIGGGDDVRCAEFSIEQASGLTLADFDDMRFAVRLTSVGEEGGAREGSLKLSDVFDNDAPGGGGGGGGDDDGSGNPDDDDDGDDTMTEDVWLAEVPCTHNADDGIDVVWKYNGGSDRLRLEVEIPIEAVTDEKDVYSFTGIDTSEIEALFTDNGYDVDDIEVTIKDGKIQIRITDEDLELTPAEVAALPDEIDAVVDVIDQDGKTWKVDLCAEVDDSKFRSPIAFDLNDDGVIGTTGPSTAKVRAVVNSTPGDTVLFDIDADGVLERIEWLTGDGDAFLVDNLDGNAATDMDGSRLFGDLLPAHDDGYEKLADWDSDGNGYVDIDDADWTGLALWVDDGNARVDAHEIWSLETFGIKSLDLDAQIVVNGDGEDLLQSKVYFDLDVIAMDMLPDIYGSELEITSFTARDDSLVYGQKLRLDLEVQNTGAADAENVKTKFYWSADNVFDADTDIQVAADKHGDLDAGEIDSNERKSIKYSKLEALGDGFIFAVIDPDDAHSEQDEYNNVSSALAFTIADPAELGIDSFTARDTTLEDGQKLKLDLTVSNSGGTHAKGVKTTFFWSADNMLDGGDTVLGMDGHGKLRAGEVDANERMRIDYDDLAALGDGYIFAMIDATNEHDEIDDSNNVASSIYIDLL